MTVWVHRRTSQVWREVERDGELVTIQRGYWLQLNGHIVWADERPPMIQHLADHLLRVEYEPMDAEPMQRPPGEEPPI